MTIKIVVIKLKSHEGVVGDEFEREFLVNGDHIIGCRLKKMAMDEIQEAIRAHSYFVDSVNEKEISKLENLEEGWYSLDAGDFIYYIEISRCERGEIKMKIEDKGHMIIIRENFLDWYDEETGGLYDTAPILYENGELVEINEKFLAIEKEEGFVLKIVDGLGNVEKIFD